jgi:hypothetical protein
MVIFAILAFIKPNNKDLVAVTLQPTYPILNRFPSVCKMEIILHFHQTPYLINVKITFKNIFPTYPPIFFSACYWNHTFLFGLIK